MAVNSIGNSNFLLAQSIQDLKSQLDTLQTQLSTGKKSTVYSGMGINEGFAIFARAQLSNLSAFTTTMTNINTTIDTTSTALQSFSQIATQVKSAAGSGGTIVTGTGQTVGQQTAVLQLKSMLEMLNTQAGDRYLFSGSAIDTPSVASTDDILNGKGALAGLKLRAEDLQIDVFHDTAVATFTSVATIQSGAETITKRERGTLIFVQHEGSWKIVHEHFSAAE